MTVSAARSTLTIRQLADLVVAQYRSEGIGVRNVQRVFRVLENDAGVKTAVELGRDDIVERFKDACAGADLSDYTANMRVATLNKIIRRTFRLGHIQREPSLPTTTVSRFAPFPAKRSAPPTEGDVERLISYLQSNATDFKGRRLYMLVSIVYSFSLEYTGCLRLKTSDDIDIDAGTIRMVRPWRGKGQPTPPRFHPMSDELKSLAAEWKREVMCEWFFPGERRLGPWDTRHPSSSAQGSLKAACLAAGIPPITFEQLRRYSRERTKSLPLPKAARAIVAGPRPSIELRGPSDPVSIRGKNKGILTTAQYKAIEILLGTDEHPVFPGGLTTAEMNSRTTKTSWRTTLRRLCEDTDWASAIGFPLVGGPGNSSPLYRILSW